ncbi:unnamed protein product [Rotaria sordida]|uniref:Uncharacterized protein n=1 Tax=Rotaria sordida TaxID=392033 RepID=A0A815AP51_9BILA|nr:unnamed protein product [Rotaria sordida]
MNKIKFQLFIYLLKPSIIFMLNNNDSFLSNEYFIDTCCSFNKNDKLNIYCNKNEIIRLNLIEIYYNSNEYCLSEYNCCKYRTNCSRRITKYSNIICNDKNSCSIDKTCLKISKPCSNKNGLYGQYITIYYSCLSLLNKTNIYLNNDNSIPFIVKLLTSEDKYENKSIINKNLIEFNYFKSSLLSLYSIIFFFLLFMFIIYSLAYQFGKKIFHKKNFIKNNKIKLNQEFFIEDNRNVQSNRSKTNKDIYSYKRKYLFNNSINRIKYPYIYYSINPYQKYIHIQHYPKTRQFYSMTFNPYFNHYTN